MAKKPANLGLALALENAYFRFMSLPLSKVLALALAVAFCACGGEQALARSKKQPVEPVEPSIMVDEGTPIIMQGLERAKRRPVQEDQDQPKRADRPIKIPRGSSAYVPPSVPSPSGGPPSPTLLRPQVAPYQPPPINSFSDRVNGCNQSFTFNGGLGNNPTNRDAYVRSCAN